MKKIRRSPVVAGLLFLLAVVLLFAGSVGGTQAALQIYSSDYISAFELDHIGITLYENGTPVSFRNPGSEDPRRRPLVPDRQEISLCHHLQEYRHH